MKSLKTSNQPKTQMARPSQRETAEGGVSIRLVFDHKSCQNDGKHGAEVRVLSVKTLFFLRREDSVPALYPGQKTGLKIRGKGAFCNFKTSSFRRSNSLRSKTSPLGCQRWQSSKTCQNFDPDMGRLGFRGNFAYASPHKWVKKVLYWKPQFRLEGHGPANGGRAIPGQMAKL